MADLHKVLHIYDIVTCSNGGVADLIGGVVERRSEVQEVLRILTDTDLLGPVRIYRCSEGCKRVVTISQGRAKDLELQGGAIPILGNLDAVSDKGCTVKWDSSLAAQLAMAENRKKHVYIDSEGHPTVGIGFNLDKGTAKDQLSKLGLDIEDVKSGKVDLTDEQIDTLFAEDAKTAQDSVKKSIPDFDSLSEARQKALTDMAFNLGSLTGWPKFVEAVNAGDFDAAAKAAGTGKDGTSPSRWVTQVGDRAKRIIAQIKGDEAYAAPQ
ncbi:MAG: glycoside hydrolase family protein [Polyangiaceae bacterium]|nr:glycoside hydrolase family protein [Polyangiaceae bacterium]